MSFRPTDSIDKTNMIMDVISMKQKAIGNNLANVNTPGYLREDVDFSRYIGDLQNPLETQLSKKLGPSPLLSKKGGEVNAARELLEMQKNALFYTVATRRMSTVIQELKSATQVGR